LCHSRTPRLRDIAVADALQVVLEERELDLLSIELSRLCPEADVAECVAVPARPTAVDPRTHHERVPLVVRTLLLHRLVAVDGPEQVLGVEPAADGHHRRLDVFEMGRRFICCQKSS